MGLRPMEFRVEMRQDGRCSQGFGRRHVTAWMRSRASRWAVPVGVPSYSTLFNKTEDRATFIAATGSNST